jgi:hypothetical protein
MRTCREIVTDNMETLESLEIINDAVIMSGNSYPMTVNDVKALLQDYLDEGRIDLDEHARAVKELDYSPELVTSDDDVFSAYLRDVLDIEIHGKRNGSEWDVTGVKAWLTLGGPNVWLVSDLTGESVEVHAAWGTDRATIHATCAGVVHYLQAFAEL